MFSKVWEVFWDLIYLAMLRRSSEISILLYLHILVFDPVHYVFDFFSSFSTLMHTSFSSYLSHWVHSIHENISNKNWNCELSSEPHNMKIYRGLWVICPSNIFLWSDLLREYVNFIWHDLFKSIFSIFSLFFLMVRKLQLLGHARLAITIEKKSWSRSFPDTHAQCIVLKNFENFL